MCEKGLIRVVTEWGRSGALWIIIWVAISGCAGVPAEQTWQWLFDGSDLDHWAGLGRADIPSDSWKIAGNTLHKIRVSAENYGGDLRTKERFRNFELCFEFKLTRGANSGVKYNVSEEMSVQHGHPSSAIGFEFQILDDLHHPDAKLGRDGNRTVGGLYDIYAPATAKPAVAAKEWHAGCIRAESDRIRHSLDGAVVLEYRLSDPDFRDRVAASKFAAIPGFAERREGYIVLQDHLDELWYRKIRVRRLVPTEPSRH